MYGYVLFIFYIVLFFGVRGCFKNEEYRNCWFYFEFWNFNCWFYFVNVGVDYGVECEEEYFSVGVFWSLVRNLN